jgi:hypothetical protein
MGHYGNTCVSLRIFDEKRGGLMILNGGSTAVTPPTVN